MASEDAASTEDRMEVNTVGKACEIAAPSPGFGGDLWGPGPVEDEKIGDLAIFLKKKQLGGIWNLKVF